jgi:glycosyltransferase involved in cell wall biosynthesis
LRASCDLAVLVHEFPKLSETFVLGDLLELERRGLRLHLFSVRRPEAVIEQDGVAELRAPVEYLPEVKGRQLKLLLRATQALLLTRDPRRYARAMAQIYASPDYTQLRYQQALLVARRLEQLSSPPLYIHFAHKAGTVGRFAALLTGAPFAISAHAVDVWTTPPAELATKVRDARVVLCCYQEAGDYLRKLGDSSTPVEVAPHGVVIPQPIRHEMHDPPEVLSVGRLVDKKGFDTLLRAARIARARGAEFRLRIVGDGPQWPMLQRLVNELELEETVRFLGPLTQTEIDQQYARASVFVLACQITAEGNRDGLPNTVLEAMARALPVVSTTLPSIAEAITDREHGLLVAPRDPEALADALTELLRDETLRARLGAAARARAVSDYDRAIHAPRVFEVLRAAGLVEERVG